MYCTFQVAQSVVRMENMHLHTPSSASLKVPIAALREIKRSWECFIKYFDQAVTLSVEYYLHWALKREDYLTASLHNRTLSTWHPLTASRMYMLLPKWLATRNLEGERKIFHHLWYIVKGGGENGICINEYLQWILFHNTHLHTSNSTHLPFDVRFALRPLILACLIQ